MRREERIDAGKIRCRSDNSYQLFEDVLRALEADAEFAEMEADGALMRPDKMLKMLKRIVNTGVTSDSTYQTMVNVRRYHEAKQGATESMCEYAD